MLKEDFLRTEVPSRQIKSKGSICSPHPSKKKKIPLSTVALKTVSLSNCKDIETLEGITKGSSKVTNNGGD